jgi:hypothetical protein
VGGIDAHSTLARFELLGSIRMLPMVLPPFGSSPPTQIRVVGPPGSASWNSTSTDQPRRRVGILP